MLQTLYCFKVCVLGYFAVPEFVVNEDSQRLLFVPFLYVPGVIHREERGISATPAQSMWRHTVSVAPDIIRPFISEYWIFV